MLEKPDPASADANSYFNVKDRIKDTVKEAEKLKAKSVEARRDNDLATAGLGKVQDNDVAEARQLAECKKRDAGAALGPLEETVAVFEKMVI